MKVHADKPSALRACPALKLLSEKRLHAVIAYKRKVFQHAHAVFRTVALIKLLYTRAELFASAAIAPAVYLREVAVFNGTPRAVFKRYIVAAAAFAVPFLALVSHTQRAVHTTGSNEGSVQNRPP